MSQIAAVDLAPSYLCDVSFAVGDPAKHEVKLYRTMSGPLRMHSKVFDAMLSEVWRTTGSPITLPDDSPVSFKLAMDIMNVEIGPMTPAPSPGELFELAQFADKYDLLALVRQCMAAWVNSAMQHDPDAFQPDELCYIGWHLNMRTLFTKAFHTLVDQTYIDLGQWRVHGSLTTGSLWHSSETLDTDLLPDGIEADIRTVATQRLHNLQERLQRFVLSAITDITEHVTWCEVEKSTQRELCDSATIGCLIQTMKMHSSLLFFEDSAVENAPPVVWGQKSLAFIGACLQAQTKFVTLRGHEKCSVAGPWGREIVRELAIVPELTDAMKAHFGSAG